jgi:hypothetical protein
VESWKSCQELSEVQASDAFNFADGQPIRAGRLLQRGRTFQQ